MKTSAFLSVVALLLSSCSGKPVEYDRYYGQNSARLNALVARIRSCGEVSYTDNVDSRAPGTCRNGDARLHQQISSDLKAAGFRAATYFPSHAQAPSAPDDKVMFVLHSEGLMLGGGSSVTLWHDPAKDYVESGDVPQSEDGRWYLRTQDDLK